MELILKSMLLIGAVICAWAAYKVIHEFIIELQKEERPRKEVLQELIPGVSKLFNLEYKKYADNHGLAPYKIEPPSASDLVAISDQPKKRGRPLGSKNKKRGRPLGSKNKKRKYTKRSPYWTKTKKAKTKKSK